jgi:ABC-2 type transport system permease protein
MRNFGVVWRFEMKQLVRKKSFLISTAVIAVLLVLVAVLPVWADTLFPAGDSQELEGGVYYQDQSLKGELPFAPEHVYDSQQALEDAVIAGDEPIGYVIVDSTHIKTVFDNYGINDTYKGTGVISLLRERNTQQILQDYGVDAATYYQIRSITIENEEVVLGKNSAAQYFSEYLFVIAVYVVILVYGQTVATTVAREKDSRTMELLITTTSPDSLILGKVAAVITVVLGALLVYGVCLFVPYLLARGSYPESVKAVLANSFDLSLLWVYIMFFLLGLVMYMFLFADRADRHRLRLIVRADDGLWRQTGAGLRLDPVLLHPADAAGIRLGRSQRGRAVDLGAGGHRLHGISGVCLDPHLPLRQSELRQPHQPGQSPEAGVRFETKLVPFFRK